MDSYQEQVLGAGPIFCAPLTAADGANDLAQGNNASGIGGGIVLGGADGPGTLLDATAFDGVDDRLVFPYGGERINYSTNPRFDVSGTWSASGDTTTFGVTDVPPPLPELPIGSTMKMVATGASPSIFNGAAISPAAVPGETWTFSAYVLPNPSNAADRTAQVRLRWYDATNVLISESNSTPIPLVRGIWTRLTVTGVAPALATSVGGRIYGANAGAVVGESAYAGAALLEKVGAVDTYFDGGAEYADASPIGTPGAAGYSAHKGVFANAGVRTYECLTFRDDLVAADVHMASADGAGTNFLLRQDTIGRLVIFPRQASNTTFNGAGLTAGAWHHSMVVADADAVPGSIQFRLYVDGAQIAGTQTVVQNYASDAGSLRVSGYGGGTGVGTQPFGGRIAYPTVYPYDASPLAKEHYNASLATQGSLNPHYGLPGAAYYDAVIGDG